MALKELYLLFLFNVKYYRLDAIYWANLAKISIDDKFAQEYDYKYAAAMEKSVYYLDKARKLRIKERIHYGNQL